MRGPRTGIPPPPGAAFGAAVSAWKCRMAGAPLGMAFPATHPSAPWHLMGWLAALVCPKLEGSSGLGYGQPPQPSQGLQPSGGSFTGQQPQLLQHCAVWLRVSTEPLGRQPCAFPWNSVWDLPGGPPLLPAPSRATAGPALGPWKCMWPYVERLNGHHGSWPEGGQCQRLASGLAGSWALAGASLRTTLQHRTAASTCPHQPLWWAKPLPRWAQLLLQSCLPRAKISS